MYSAGPGIPSLVVPSLVVPEGEGGQRRGQCTFYSNVYVVKNLLTISRDQISVLKICVSVIK